MEKVNNRNARRSEGDIETDALNVKLIKQEIFSSDCKQSRGDCSGCPNRNQCRNKFRGLSNVILKLRERIFHGDPGTTESEGRKQNLRSLLLLGLTDTTSGGSRILFSMGGITVCKAFYRDCTGLRRQFFDEVINELLGSGTPVVPRRKRGRKTTVVQVGLRMRIAAILDLMFRAKKTKADPTGKVLAMSIRSSWRDVFEIDFKKYTGGVDICSYRTFCHVRKTDRPYYGKSPRMKKSKFYRKKQIISIILT